MEPNQLRIILLVAGALLLAAIYFFGRPRKPDQGKRVAGRRGGGRVEPVLGDDGEPVDDGAPRLDADGEELSPETIQSELELLERTLAGDPTPVPAHRVEHGATPAPSTRGARTDPQFDRIVTLYVAARPGETINGADFVVAAEKAGLEFGHMSIFHRLVDGKPEQGPVFSVASMVKPGNFDMARIGELETPGLSLFMTLPGPLPALDAWETMLPTAQRLAELLDAQVLDEERNALGRQRVAHIRDELRAYDRKREQQELRSRW